MANPFEAFNIQDDDEEIVYVKNEEKTKRSIYFLNLSSSR
jgi:hypothetical protein